MDTTKTCEPLVQRMVEKHEEFSKETIEEYLMNRASFSKFPLRHYRQLEHSFDVRRVGELLKRLQIPVEITTLIFGGYTGQFAKVLRDLGMRVTFTDPLEEWVTEAKKSGLEAYCHSAEGLPADLLDRCQLAATFECYPPLQPWRVYSILRLLARERGLLFAESEQTRKDMQAEGASAGLTSEFLPYFKVYSIKRVRREKGDLRLYHYCTQNPETREMMFVDMQIMKALHDSLRTETTLTLDALLSVPEISAMGEGCVDQSLKRIVEIHYLTLPDSLKFLLWTKGIDIGTKSFRLDQSQLTKFA